MTTPDPTPARSPASPASPASYGPYSLEKITRMVESGSNAHAMRFEHAAFLAKEAWMAPQIAAIKKGNYGISDDTAWCIACTSYGFYQVLGATLYSFHPPYDVIDFCEDVHEQLNIFTQFCNDAGFSPSENVSVWDDFRFAKWAQHQNGPGDTTAYVAEMRKTLQLIMASQAVSSATAGK